jgi:hypothetical protein
MPGWRVIRSAWATFSIAGLILGAIIYIGLEWHHAKTLSELRAAIANKQFENDILRKEVKGASRPPN